MPGSPNGFDEAFLEVPPEVIQLTARVNQKYFVCTDPPPPRAGEDRRIANGFVCTANIAAIDGGVEIVAGNRKVLAARLSDARFFWEQDQKKTLEQHAEKLKNITFHERLGTVADKVERVAKLARWLVEQGIVADSPLPFRGGVGGGVSRPQPTDDGPHPNPSPEGEGLSLADQAELAARLCKADLVTEMVGEFPELQGLMGGYYARAEGLPQAVADAIRDHYKPVGQGDDVPTAPVTVAVALADKLDTLSCFFVIGESPTGSKDPFALRRQCLGAIRLIGTGELRLNIAKLVNSAMTTLFLQRAFSAPAAKVAKFNENSEPVQPMGVIADPTGGARQLYQVGSRYIEVPLDDRVAEDVVARMRLAAGMFNAITQVVDFFADRLKVQQREAGVRHDLIDAVFALGGEDDLVRLLARVKALQAFMATEDGTNLLAGYKRAANILKQAGVTSPLPFRGGAGGGVSRPQSTDDGPHPNPSPEGEGLDSPPTEADAALLAAIDTAEPAAAAAVADERFTDAMAALALLRAPIDAFFEGVMVNDPDDEIRAYRLGLLARFTGAVHGVADFSKIEG